MLSTTDILAMMKERLGSYYKVAQELGVHPNRVNQMRHHGGKLTFEQGLIAAKFLGVSDESIILSLAAEKSRNTPSFEDLARLAAKHTPKLSAVAGVFALAILATGEILTNPMVSSLSGHITKMA
ncbi:hypothetical protein [Microbulbifer sp. VVAC002]|uniref:hypothetical protein n=1 Tax=Microbulbifer sp. VVAC002 TaxID=3243387 RepID=UPI004039FE08